MRIASDEEISSRKASIFEILLITLILLSSVAAILWTRVGDLKRTKDDGVAVIYRAGRVLERVSLQQDGVIALPDGGMKIEVKESKVRVAWSDCPKQICVNTGWIKTPGEVIVCVPNKVLIEIESAYSPALDAVVR